MSGAISAVLWALVAAVMFIIEGITVELVTLWFGFGALVAMLAAALGAPLWLQLVLFLLASVSVLFIGRPLLKDYLTVRKQATNADRVIGQIGVVDQAIDNVAQAGRITVMGLSWMARSAQGQVIPQGSKVTVLQIEGVKLIVQPLEHASVCPDASGEGSNGQA